VSVSQRSELTRRYDVHGVRLEVRAPDARLGAAVASRLRQFARNSIQVGACRTIGRLLPAVGGGVCLFVGLSTMP
jgi:hypothetical protein